MTLINEENELIDESYIFEFFKIKKFSTSIDKINLYRYINDMISSNFSNNKFISIYNEQLNLFKRTIA